MTTLRVLFFLLLISVTAKAQLYNIRNFSTEQGLPESRINTLCEDRRGNLWIGTSGAGLVRFDGYTFYSYHQEDGLVNSYVRSVFEDNSGVLWIGTEAGLCKYDGYSITRVPILETETITSIVQDASGRYWFGTGNGLFRYDGKKLVPFGANQHQDFNKKINCLYIDKNADLWIGTGGGLAKYSGLGLTLFTKEDGLPSNDVRSIVEDSNSDLWLATDGGVSKMHDNTFENYNARNGLRSQDIHAVVQDDKKNLWFGTSLGVVKYDGKTFQQHEDVRGQTNNIITCVYNDSEGNLWFGSSQRGLGKLDSERFVHYPENDQLGKRVYSIIQAINGNIICGTSLGGTTVFDGRQYTLLNKREGFTSSIVQSFYYAPDSSLWVGTADEGMFRFSKSNLHQYDTEEGFVSRNVTGFAANSGMMWIATADSGVAVVQTPLDTLRTIRRFNTVNGLSSNRITSIASAGSAIWIGTEDHGINKILVSPDTLKADSILHVTMEEGLNSNSIHAIITDSLGRVFIGTSQGVNIFDGTQVVSLSRLHGLTSNNIYSLTIDGNGNLWTGTERGVDMITFSADLKSTTIRHFESNEGFKGLEVYRNSSCVDKEGNVWFGTVNGLVKYNPREEIESKVLPKIHITGLKLFFDDIQDTKYADSVSAWYSIPRRLTLPYNQNNLTFSFVGIHHRNPQAVRYKWMLEGFDEDWSPPMNEREVTYSNIPPGNYTFRVIACNEYNIWSESPASFSFSVKPPFWEQWWAKVSGILIIVLLTAAVFQVRVRRIKEKNRIEQERLEMEKNILELEQEAARLQMNPHFIFNSLNSIQGFIATNDPFQAKKYLAKFAKLMRLILENAREEFIPLQNEISILENYLELEKLSTNHKFDFAVTADESIDLENIQIPPMMIQPFVENAIIHGIKKKEGKGTIRIHFSVKGDLIICTLQDDGIGRKRSGAINGQSRGGHKSTGISVTQKRLEQYGLHRKVDAGVRIIDLEENGNAAGTKVIISTPFESY